MEPWIIVAIVIAVLLLVCCCCWCCCCVLCDGGNNNQKLHGVDVERGIPNHYKTTSDSSDEDGNETDGIHRINHNDIIYMDDENKVAERAATENGTLLWTNHKQVFINHPGRKHAEIMLISSDIDPNSITTIHIKNSPCCKCSKALRRHFSKRRFKPTILVGRIWHLNDEDDDAGLICLLKEGFKLTVWNKLHDRMYGQEDTSTLNYIRQLNNKKHLY